MYIEQCVSLVFLFWGEVGNFRSSWVVPHERARSTNSESRRVKLLRDGCACVSRVKLGMRNVRRVHLTDIWSWYRVTLRVGDHLGRSEELVSRCVECDLAEPESLASLGGSATGVVDGILSLPFSWVAVSPLQNRIGLSMGHTVANSQCLLRMSAGLLLPSFQWNEMYLGAIASLTR